MKGKTVILQVKEVYKTYQAKNGEVEALKNINFNIKYSTFYIND